MKIRYLALTALYCAGIFWLSSKPNPPDVPLPFAGADKLMHAILYAGLTAIVSVGIRRSNRQVTFWVQAAVPLVFAAVYGLTDEIHQIFVPTRSFDPLDLAANVTGAAIMQAMLLAWWRLRRPRSTSSAPSPH